MKYTLSSLLATLALGMLAITPTTYASTPDGQTPAEEGTCDPLKAEGITKGLYLSLIHISEPTRQLMSSRMPSSA